MENKHGSSGNQHLSNVSHANDGLSSQLLQKGLTSANLQGALKPAAAPAPSASSQPSTPAQAPAASTNSSKG